MVSPMSIRRRGLVAVMAMSAEPATSPAATWVGMPSSGQVDEPRFDIPGTAELVKHTIGHLEILGQPAQQHAIIPKSRIGAQYQNDLRKGSRHARALSLGREHRDDKRPAVFASLPGKDEMQDRQVVELTKGARRLDLDARSAESPAAGRPDELGLRVERSDKFDGALRRECLPGPVGRGGNPLSRFAVGLFQCRDASEIDLARNEALSGLHRPVRSVVRPAGECAHRGERLLTQTACEVGTHSLVDVVEEAMRASEAARDVDANTHLASQVAIDVLPVAMRRRIDLPHDAFREPVPVVGGCNGLPLPSYSRHKLTPFIKAPVDNGRHYRSDYHG